MPPIRSPARKAQRSANALVAASVSLLLLAGSAFAFVALDSPSTLTIGVISPPVIIEDGDGAAKSRYIEDYEPTLNQTGFTATVTGRVGGEVKVKDVVRVRNLDDASSIVMLRAVEVANVNIEEFAWVVKDGSTTIGTLDLLAASPSVTFSLPAGASYELDLQLRVAKGAGKNNATEAFSMWVVIL